MRNITTNRWLVILAVSVVALVLRLIFITTSSKIFIIYDADIYWQTTQIIPTASLNEVASTLYGRTGILPLLLSPILSLFDNTPQTAYITFAVWDALIVVMIMHILLRLRWGLTAAAIAGILYAVYVPSITSTGAFLQQPLLRFTLTLTLWAFNYAFTARTLLGVRIAVTIGIVGTFLFGFGSITTRPLLWVIPSAVIGTTYLASHSMHKAIRRNTLKGLAALTLSVGVLWLISAPTNQFDALLRLTIGIGSSGEALQDQSTVLTFEHFWAPSSWQTLQVSETKSLFNDLLRDPMQFSIRSVFSVIANLRYPDVSMMQAFGLGFTGQKTQHTVMILLGFSGLLLFIGQRDERRESFLVMLAASGVLTAIYSIVSVEPRRITTLMPIIALMAGPVIPAIVNTVRIQIGYLKRFDLIVPLLWIISWLPFWLSLGTQIIPNPEFVYLLLMTVRFGLTLALGWHLLTLWQKADVIGLSWLPRFALVIIVGMTAVYAYIDTTWRPWKAHYTESITQQISGITVQEGLFPWLVIEVDSPQAVEIRVDDSIVKAGGQPMREWTTGLPAIWPPYETLAQMSNTTVTRQRWYATPLSPDLLMDSIITVTVNPVDDSGFTIAGDYHQTESTTYTGPLWSPWYDGNSFWRWQWNATDGRIPAQQNLGSVQIQTDNTTRGIYRIFLVQTPFANTTNAFGAPQNPQASTLCTEDERLIMAPDTQVHICQHTELGTVRYYADDTFFGESELEVFLTQAQQNTRIDLIESDAGKVEVYQVLNVLFVANFYDSDGGLIYSAIFSFV